MQIADWLADHGIDPDKYKYVWHAHGSFVRTPWGQVDLPYGYLWDGASCVVDLVPEASAAHDRLYRLPYVTRQTDAGHVHRVRLNRYQCDLVYGYLLFKGRRPLFALVRPLGLIVANSTRWGPWNGYRRREAAMGAAEWERYCAAHYVIPGAHKWLLPTRRTRDARYIPDGVAAHAE